jgi:hypothetical protein
MMMTAQGMLVRNLALAIVNGAITLIILLIAPLGLAAVMINTLLVTLATFVTATASDRIILFLQGGTVPRSMRAIDDMSVAELSQRERRGDLRR